MQFILKKTATTQSVGQLRQKIGEIDPTFTPISSERALAYFMENSLTKQQYINTKQLSKQHGCNIYPPYSQIVEEKLKCRPQGIVCFENETKVSLQSLLDHTTSRILLMQKKYVNHYQTKALVHLFLATVLMALQVTAYTNKNFQ